MRRDVFLKAAGLLSVTGALSTLPSTARAAGSMKMLIPADRGGAWDTTGRALGRALREAGVASAVGYHNEGGAAGAIGLAQFVRSARGDPSALIVMGTQMLGGSVDSRQPWILKQGAPIARLTSEPNVFVLPENSAFKSMNDVVNQLKKDPGSVTWGGGPRGSAEHIAAAMVASAVGVDPPKINYVAFADASAAMAAILSGRVTVGGSGYSDFAAYTPIGKLRPIGVTSNERLPGSNVPTLKEQGIDVEISSWRGVYGAPGITKIEQLLLVSDVTRAIETNAWIEALQEHGWKQAILTGDRFGQFVDQEFANLREVMTRSSVIS